MVQVRLNKNKNNNNKKTIWLKERPFLSQVKLIINHAGYKSMIQNNVCQLESFELTQIWVISDNLDWQSDILSC